MPRLPFPDRDAAAHALAAALERYRDANPLVFGIPRGGVPMARIVADTLGGDVDVVLVRKIGAPGYPELAVGAVDEQGSVMLNEGVAWPGLDDAYVRAEAGKQMQAIRARRARYGGAASDPRGRTVIVVDDGIATGATMVAALHALRARRPRRLVCATPVASMDSLERVRRIADEVVCLATPIPFHAVGMYYARFPGVSDDEAQRALRTPAARDAIARSPVSIPFDGRSLPGELDMPRSPIGIVVFAHGSGSSRRSARNRFVADTLNRRRIATLLFDLLTEEEDVAQARFDIGRLADRLLAAMRWVDEDPRCRDLPLGIFGASTGAAAALRVAAMRPETVAAVVSRGGRPDLAGERVLACLRKPVLFIVGGADTDVLASNRAARASMGAWAELRIVPGAGHLFEEPGTLEQVANMAADWLQIRLGMGGSGGAAALG